MAGEIETEGRDELRGDVPGPSELGANIRRIRQTETELTIEALAQAAGVSTSLISQIERGQAEPSLSSLRRIGVALGVPIARFFLGEETNGGGSGENDRFGRQIIVRSNRRKHLRTPEAEITWELLVPDLNRKLEVLFGEVEPGAMTPPADAAPSQHIGEEVLVILDGTLTCVIDDDSFVLEAGDSISIDSTRPHRIANYGDEKVRMVIVHTPPAF